LAGATDHVDAGMTIGAGADVVVDDGALSGAIPSTVRRAARSPRSALRRARPRLFSSASFASVPTSVATALKSSSMAVLRPSIKHRRRTFSNHGLSIPIAPPQPSKKKSAWFAGSRRVLIGSSLRKYFVAARTLAKPAASGRY